MDVVVKILPSSEQPSARKLADAELHFRGGDLDGLKLVGFSIWKRRDREAIDVTVPSREFTVGGRRRRYALLRAIEKAGVQCHVRDSVLRAYAAYQAEMGPLRNREAIVKVHVDDRSKRGQ